MCIKYYSNKIYLCGKVVTQFVKFEPCAERDKPGHTVKDGTMGSSRVKEGCGAFNCPGHWWHGMLATLLFE
jgi:hypothetical protein